MKLSASRWAFSFIWPQAFVISTRGDEIEESADAAIYRHVQKHGALNSRIYVDLVKDLAVETALSKVFYNYDPERAKKGECPIFHISQQSGKQLRLERTLLRGKGTEEGRTSERTRNSARQFDFRRREISQ